MMEARRVVVVGRGGRKKRWGNEKCIMHPTEEMPAKKKSVSLCQALGVVLAHVRMINLSTLCIKNSIQ